VREGLSDRVRGDQDIALPGEEGEVGKVCMLGSKVVVVDW
jgi:hypothetical protein